MGSYRSNGQAQAHMAGSEACPHMFGEGRKAHAGKATHGCWAAGSEPAAKQPCLPAHWDYVGMAQARPEYGRRAPWEGLKAGCR